MTNKEKIYQLKKSVNDENDYFSNKTKIKHFALPVGYVVTFFFTNPAETGISNALFYVLAALSLPFILIIYLKYSDFNSTVPKFLKIRWYIDMNKSKLDLRNIIKHDSFAEYLNYYIKKNDISRLGEENTRELELVYYKACSVYIKNSILFLSLNIVILTISVVVVMMYTSYLYGFWIILSCWILSLFTWLLFSKFKK